MILGVGDVHVQIPHRLQAERAMAEAARGALAQEGCLSFVFAEVLEDPGHFIVVESWSDQEAVERLRRVADRHNVTPGAVAVAWTLANPAVDGAIVGFRSAEQVDPVLAAAELRLSPEDVREIEGA